MQNVDIMQMDPIYILIFIQKMHAVSENVLFQNRNVLSTIYISRKTLSYHLLKGEILKPEIPE